jgi:hypothetical protein
VKYEEVYLRAYDSVSDARAPLGRYLDLYNRRRPHSNVDDQAPDQAYFGHTSLLEHLVSGHTPLGVIERGSCSKPVPTFRDARSFD